MSSYRASARVVADVVEAVTRMRLSGSQPPSERLVGKAVCGCQHLAMMVRSARAHSSN